MAKKRADRLQAIDVEGFIARVRQVMAGDSEAAFAEKANISQSGLNRILNGGLPSLDVLIAIAVAGGVPIGWLAAGKDDATEAQPFIHLPDFALVPRYEVSASAGHGLVPVSEDISERVAFRTDWLREIGVAAANAAVLTANGDSMEPLIPDGALMLVDVSIREVRNGCIYVIVKDGDLLVKRVHRKVDGTISLISENTRYPPEEISPALLDKLHIVGRVRWVGRAI